MIIKLDELAKHLKVPLARARELANARKVLSHTGEHGECVHFREVPALRRAAGLRDD